MLWKTKKNLFALFLVAFTLLNGEGMMLNAAQSQSYRLEKVVSGGQTGVDRAALDAAIACKIAHGGWCPLGRLAELGETIPEKYQLKETDSSDYSVRTLLNIRDSDATLIIIPHLPVDVTDGTILTIESVKKSGKPFLLVDTSLENADQIHAWLSKNAIRVLNIAGPRESQSPGIYNSSYQLILKFLCHGG